MKVEIKKDKSGCEHVCGILLKDFSKWYGEFHQGVRQGGTTHLEDDGRKFLEKCLTSNPTDPAFQNEVKKFIKEIMQWGVVPGRREYWLKKIFSHPDEFLAHKICEAAKELKQGNLQSAFDILKKNIDGMGLAVASKSLRMMSPEKAVAFDSILNDELSYTANGIGYEGLCNDCREVANELNNRAKKSPDFVHPQRGEGGWFSSDVEAVLYWCLSGKIPKSDYQKIRNRQQGKI